ncbi:hypothetical protein EBN03_08870 [Nocardia stercoris]|uniref:Uncharacterized protein n=1 Tax=Nocardia stercoris TaxID=2483361 RepID=A0A3M2L7G3_9NOCA|nr:hypothetical protein EBN03_08870 [Nocardia stercoris]
MVRDFLDEQYFRAGIGSVGFGCGAARTHMAGHSVATAAAVGATRSNRNTSVASNDPDDSGTLSPWSRVSWSTDRFSYRWAATVDGTVAETCV